ncbi:MAG: alkaline phosphatase [Clostridia bacterium]|nr:alkaline phosphatase [Clostridia bacterium]
MKKKTIKLISVIIALSLILTCLSSASAIVIPDVKNVILMIGDGMGENSIEWTKAELGYKAFMDTLPYQGYSQTDSLSGTTDSAAGATALSCGKRVYNSNLCTLSVLIDGQGAVVCSYKNLSEVAKSMGKRAGIVTSDQNSGATPAGFSVHTYKRELAEEITAQQKDCGLDLIWAADNGLSNKEEFEAAGWTYAQSLTELTRVENGERSFAAISGSICFETGSKSDAPLSTLTTMAIKNLDNPDGFFLTVEGAHIDKNSHSNNKEGMMKALMEFDKAVENAVAYASERSDTIVVVTADHETGGITYNEETKSYEYTSGNHSNVDVPLRIYGSDRLVKDGKSVKNSQVAVFIADEMGYNGRFPDASINPAFIFDLFAALFKAAKAKIAA